MKATKVAVQQALWVAVRIPVREIACLTSTSPSKVRWNVNPRPWARVRSWEDRSIEERESAIEEALRLLGEE